jgi:hypothetical protein
MKKQTLVLGFGVLAAGVLLTPSPAQAAVRKHLVVVHASDNTGQGVVSVDKSKLHPYPLDNGAPPDCSTAACGASYARGTRVTLTATPAAGSTFAGWSGECTGTAPTCVVRLDRSRDVMVRFSK